MKPVVTLHGVSKTKGLLHDFFESDDDFVQRSDYGIGAFLARVNKLAAVTNGAGSGVAFTAKTAGNMAAGRAFLKRSQIERSTIDTTATEVPQ